MFATFLIRMDGNKIRAIVKLQAYARGLIDRSAAQRLRNERDATLEYRERIRRQRREELAAYTLQTGWEGHKARAEARARRDARDKARAAAAAAAAKAKQAEGGVLGSLIRRASFRRGDNEPNDGSKPAYNGVAPGKGATKPAGASAASRAKPPPDEQDDMAAAVRLAARSGGVADAPQAKVGKPNWLDRAVNKGGESGGGGGGGGGLMGGLARRLSWRAADKPAGKAVDETPPKPAAKSMLGAGARPGLAAKRT